VAGSEHLFRHSKFSEQLAQTDVTKTRNQGQTQPVRRVIYIGRRHEANAAGVPLRRGRREKAINKTNGGY
jgi:hypothetical protein